MNTVYKDTKLNYYLQGICRGILPADNYEKVIDELVRKLTKQQLESVEERVEYYNRLVAPFTAKNGTEVSDLLKPKTPKSYYFDTYEHARHFPKSQKIDFVFGDINYILESPAITKSRPISGNNANNVLLKLDRQRHFVHVKDRIEFHDKENLLFGRSGVFQEHRYRFYHKYFGHPLCDLGQVNIKGGNPAWIKPKTSIKKHLTYKFILSLEGNDVATNLKWIMSSNSIAVSPPLKIETWYMEGKLIPGEHFICISENYDNLEDTLQYYLDHEAEAEEIIQNAQRFREQFNNQYIEKLTALLTLKKYFSYIR